MQNVDPVRTKYPFSELKSKWVTALRICSADSFPSLMSWQPHKHLLLYWTGATVQRAYREWLSDRITARVLASFASVKAVLDK